MPTIFLEKEDVTKTVDATTLKEVYEKLNINSTTVIATKNDELIIESTKLNSKDKIKILPVISGG
ncbi:MAG: thiamine biosynthesis protein ThiS [Nanoarchaeota archaeon]|nr:thiamine biosynthesis protein ThiS [Nanoarchaeota archaeon]|tara:strand:+ start:674 stop:868 length:195 start_codon:yes stop_codon:yes gene_type:complete